MSLAPALLATAAAPVRLRLATSAWLELQGRVGPLLLTVPVALMTTRLAGVDLAWWPLAAVAGTVLWLPISALWAWWRRPAVPTALATWDRAAGLQDRLLNAWDLAIRGESGRFAHAHIEAVVASLPVLTPEVPRHLPVAVPRPAWLVVAAVAILTVLPLLPPPATPAPPPADLAAQQQLAASAAAAQAEAARLPPGVLDAAEKARLDELQQRIKAAQDEARQQGLGREEALRRLDQLARSAEDLAAQLAAAQKPDGALLAELERHADTADLGAALRQGDQAKAAAAAEALAARLQRADLTLDEQRRLSQALDRAANANDPSAAGKAVAAAAQALRAGQRPAAANAFAQLGSQLARQAQRQNAAKQVANLASRLRTGGGRMVNVSASQRPAGLPTVRPPSAAKPPSLVQRLGATPWKPPSNSSCSSNSTCPGGIPVPGSQPCQNPKAGSGSCSSSGSCPVPGTSTSASAKPGGSKAGRGHVDSSQAPTAPRTGGADSTVEAPQGQGASETTQVAGQAHAEAAAVVATATPQQTVDAEERALDADPLPAGRREQVKAYFALLRSQLEH